MFRTEMILGNGEVGISTSKVTFKGKENKVPCLVLGEIQKQEVGSDAKMYGASRIYITIATKESYKVLKDAIDRIGKNFD